MKFKGMRKIQIILGLALIASLLPLSVQAKTITNNYVGTHEGYYCELWKDYGNGTMELEEGKVGFSCKWSNVNDILFEYGMKCNQRQTHQETGNISISYECSYESISEYGYTLAGIHVWTVYPTVEVFIVESHDNWKPKADSSPLKTIIVDGAEYDIYENYIILPEMQSYKQYLSIRREPRTSGTVSVSQHLRVLEALGVKLGKLYQITFAFEGYQSEGSGELTKINIDIDTDYSLPGDVNEDKNIDSLDFAVFRKYLLGKINTIPSNADINQDGNIDSLDFSLLRMHLLGKIFLGVTTKAS